MRFPGEHRHSSNMSPSSLPQGLCTCWLLCLQYSSQMFEWLAPPHSDLSLNIASLKGLSCHLTSCVSFSASFHHVTFSISFTHLATLWSYTLFMCFLVYFCFSNAPYNVNTVITTLSSFLAIVVPTPRKCQALIDN